MPNRPTSRVTAEEIARRLGISRTTVSLVLNGRAESHRISAETTERVLAAAKAAHYRPNIIARQLAGKGSSVVGVLVSTAAVPDPRLIQMMETAAAEHGIRFIVGHAVGTRERVLDYLDDFRARGVDAIISIFHSHPEYSSVVEPELLRFPNVVFYERPGDRPDGGTNAPCYVEADFPAVGRISVEHLIQRGRRRIGLMLTNVAFPYAVHRRAAHMQTLADHGLATDDSLVWILDQQTHAKWTVPFTPELAARVVQDLIVEQKVDAIVAVNDMYAARLMTAIRRSGRRIPDDVAIVGCDNADIAELIDPALTTIDLNVEAIARAMTDMLLELLKNGAVPPERREIVIPPTLVARAST